MFFGQLGGVEYYYYFALIFLYIYDILQPE